MPQLKEVNVTPQVIRWARKSAGFSIEEAAAKIGRPEEEIEAWESGDLKPTMAQVRKACETYKRPLAVFFLPEPPSDFSTLRDFRRLPADVPRAYSPALRFLLRQTHYRQEWLSEFLQSEEQAPLAFIGSGSISNDPLKLAQRIREALRVTREDIRNCRTREEALGLWVSRTEDTGIFVFRAGNMRWEKIDVIEARGFVLSDPYAPFIFLNAQDAKAAQVFTLAHELVHLWLNESGVSNLRTASTPTTQADRIEIFCNRVAADILVPADEFQGRWKQGDPTTPLGERIDMQSKYFKVSEWVIARRLLDSGQISKAKYDALAQEYEEQWHKQRTQEKENVTEGGPSYYRLKLVNDGYAFTKTVLSAYQSGRLSGRDTSSLLGVKLNKMEKLAALIAMPIRWRRTAS